MAIGNGHLKISSGKTRIRCEAFIIGWMLFISLKKERNSSRRKSFSSNRISSRRYCTVNDVFINQNSNTSWENIKLLKFKTDWSLNFRNTFDIFESSNGHVSFCEFILTKKMLADKKIDTQFGSLALKYSSFPSYNNSYHKAQSHSRPSELEWFLSINRI